MARKTRRGSPRGATRKPRQTRARVERPGRSGARVDRAREDPVIASPGGAWASSERVATEELRFAFWETAGRECPDAFRKLAEIPVPPEIAANWRDYCDHGFARPSDADAVEFEADLLGWAVYHRLSEDSKRHQAWVLAFARETRLCWETGFHRAPEPHLPFKVRVRVSAHPPGRLEPDASGGWVAPDEGTRIDSEPFDPAAETQDDFLRRQLLHSQLVLARARGFLPAVFDPRDAKGALASARRREAAEKRKKKAAEKRKKKRDDSPAGWVRARRFTLAHMRWLIAWRFGRNSIEEISRKARVSRVTVFRAVQRLANELGLPQVRQMPRH